ncbi:uncharacterized protein LOC120255431 [Dioscorea cayenensis subsp. rotundata]|uniref:Uncharacterized protein LOC120255431 n=1 Tax=Dioscorea cayennensis subsp. rotundata TaxID=55577 RepID=A0AB40AWH0_DIOCR|nr:uncharacterized protein LOC120255431 [Dioscorea cayenensis subsp. rotundata]
MNLDVIDIETNPRIADCVVAILKNRIRDHRQSLKKYYLSFSDYEDARKKKPNEFITQANWEDLCDYWDNDKTKERAKKAKVSRSYMKTPHNQGSKSFVVVRHELMKKDDESIIDEQHECNRIELYKSTHYKKGKGWASLEAKANYCAMQQKFKKAIDENQDVDVDKICDEVLGTRSGYIKGLGYGPKPNASRCGHAKIIKDLEEEKKYVEKEI